MGLSENSVSLDPLVYHHFHSFSPYHWPFYVCHHFQTHPLITAMLLYRSRQEQAAVIPDGLKLWVRTAYCYNGITPNVHQF